MTTPPSADEKNRQVLRVLIGIIAALVLGCFVVATRW